MITDACLSWKQLTCSMIYRVCQNTTLWGNWTTLYAGPGLLRYSNGELMSSVRDQSLSFFHVYGYLGFRWPFEGLNRHNSRVYGIKLDQNSKWVVLLGPSATISSEHPRNKSAQTAISLWKKVFWARLKCEWAFIQPNYIAYQYFSVTSVEHF